MTERIIDLTDIDPKEFFGTQDSTLALLKKFFPKIKIVARGVNLKIYGESEILDEFEKRFEMLIKYFNKYNKLDENSIERILTSTGKEEKVDVNAKDVLLHGVNGKLIKAQTVNQRKMVSMMQKNDMLFAVGPAGTGKTYTAVALAVKALKEKEEIEAEALKEAQQILSDADVYKARMTATARYQSEKMKSFQKLLKGKDRTVLLNLYMDTLKEAVSSVDKKIIVHNKKEGKMQVRLLIDPEKEKKKGTE